jgi:hypothetical protein
MAQLGHRPQQLHFYISRLLLDRRLRSPIFVTVVLSWYGLVHVGCLFIFQDSGRRKKGGCGNFLDVLLCFFLLLGTGTWQVLYIFVHVKFSFSGYLLTTIISPFRLLLGSIPSTQP